MILALAALASVAAASPAPSGITYLECTTTGQSDGAHHWTVTLNEPEGSVTYDPHNGAGFVTRPAKFTGDAVYFIGFTLSRIDLTMSRQVGVGVWPDDRTVTESGQCELSKPAKRAF